MKNKTRLRCRIVHERRGLQLKDVASQVGISPGRLSQVETGNLAPTERLRERLAAFYEVDKAFLWADWDAVQALMRVVTPVRDSRPACERCGK